ncbi:MAG: HPr family phosphocarrier protein [Gammaproteobacteria bacterium]|nr:HPr family phosphocarrier protein [Gammaproteobacteria bacterium]
MPKKHILICNKLGLHARAAAKLVFLTSTFNCDVFLQKGDKRINAKSIMGVMMLAASKGTQLTLETTGEDAEQAIIEIEQLVNNRFEEDE